MASYALRRRLIMPLSDFTVSYCKFSPRARRSPSSSQTSEPAPVKVGEILRVMHVGCPKRFYPSLGVRRETLRRRGQAYSLVRNAGIGFNFSPTF